MRKLKYAQIPQRIKVYSEVSIHVKNKKKKNKNKTVHAIAQQNSPATSRGCALWVRDSAGRQASHRERRGPNKGQAFKKNP